MSILSALPAIIAGGKAIGGAIKSVGNIGATNQGNDRDAQAKHTDEFLNALLDYAKNKDAKRGKELAMSPTIGEIERLATPEIEDYERYVPSDAQVKRQARTTDKLYIGGQIVGSLLSNLGSVGGIGDQSKFGFNPKKAGEDIAQIGSNSRDAKMGQIAMNGESRFRHEFDQIKQSLDSQLASGTITRSQYQVALHHAMSDYNNRVKHMENFLNLRTRRAASLV